MKERKYKIEGKGKKKGDRDARLATKFEEQYLRIKLLVFL